jgi:hypothetical protein
MCSRKKGGMLPIFHNCEIAEADILRSTIFKNFSRLNISPALLLLCALFDFVIRGELFFPMISSVRLKIILECSAPTFYIQ